jgi:hypothetical protein
MDKFCSGYVVFHQWMALVSQTVQDADGVLSVIMSSV